VGVRQLQINCRLLIAWPGRPRGGRRVRFEVSGVLRFQERLPVEVRLKVAHSRSLSKAEASFTHSQTLARAPKLPYFAERLESVKLASALPGLPDTLNLNRAAQRGLTNHAAGHTLPECAPFLHNGSRATFPRFDVSP